MKPIKIKAINSSSIRRFNKQAGVAEIEFAILLPLALLLWWLISDLSLWLQQQQRLQQLSHDWVMLLASLPEQPPEQNIDASWQAWLSEQWQANEQGAPDYTVLRWSLEQQQNWRSGDCADQRQQAQLQSLLQTTVDDEEQAAFWLVSLCAPLPGYLIRHFIPSREPTVLRANSISVAR